MRPEIWAYGFRNPWRFTFDPDGLLIAADVGDRFWEEVNIVRKGGNYGWDVLEGTHCFPPGSACPVDNPELTAPIWEVRNPEDTCAIMGGVVYSRKGIPEIAGLYLYGDFCTGRIWGIRYDENGRVTEHRLLVSDYPEDLDPYNISGFAKDNAGNTYVLTLFENSGIYRLIH